MKPFVMYNFLNGVVCLYLECWIFHSLAVFRDMQTGRYISFFSYFQAHYFVICNFFQEQNWFLFSSNSNEILEPNIVKSVLSSKKIDLDFLSLNNEMMLHIWNKKAEDTMKYYMCLIYSFINAYARGLHWTMHLKKTLLTKHLPINLT